VTLRQHPEIIQIQRNKNGKVITTGRAGGNDFLNYGANQAAQRIARAVGFWTRWGNLTINHKSLDKLLMLLHILD
jgi:hypothetical protein